MPVPGNGLGLVTLSHVADVAAMVAAAVPGKPAALGQHFNVCSDRAVTHAGEWGEGGAAATGGLEVALALWRGLKGCCLVPSQGGLHARSCRHRAHPGRGGGTGGTPRAL